MQKIIQIYKWVPFVLFLNFFLFYFVFLYLPPINIFGNQNIIIYKNGDKSVHLLISTIYFIKYNMNNIPIILTLYVGFIHAFETDHILAVSNIVTNRDKSIKALKDGLSWGLGHTSTILIMGTLVLLMKFNISDSVFSYFEAVVGVVLVSLGIHRIIQWYKRKYSMAATHTHEDGSVNNGSHLPAFLIGLF